MCALKVFSLSSLSRPWCRAVILCLFLFTIFLYVIRPYEEANVSRVDRRLLNVGENLQEIDVFFYLDDEDSCGFRFIGSDKNETVVAVINPKSNVKVYIGSLIKLDEMKEIPHSDENVKLIIEMIRNHPNMDERRARALVKISRRVRDDIRLRYIKFK